MSHAPSFLRALVAGSALAAAAPLAQAQPAALDARWQPWAGCWTPTSDAPGAPLTCIVPAAGTSAVDIVTVADGRVTARQHVEASGARRVKTDGGCTGWESATWSADGQRVFLRAEAACAGNVQRHSSGVLALQPDGTWLDVRGVSAGGAADPGGVRVLRFRDAGRVATLPAEVAAALPAASEALADARTMAGAPVSIDDVVEATRRVDARVAEAWIAERGQSFALDAKRIVALADAGVPTSVIDVMIAASYPRTFAINPGSREGELRAPTSRTDVATNAPVGATIPVFLDPLWYGASGYGSYYGSPYGYGYGSAYGARYGYRPGYGYGYYPGGQPVIVVVRRPGDTDGTTSQPRPRAVRGRGYTQGDDGSTGAPARPSGTRSSEGSTSTSSGSTSGGSTSSGSSTNSGSTGRTAKPRP